MVISRRDFHSRLSGILPLIISVSFSKMFPEPLMQELWYILFFMVWFPMVCSLHCAQLWFMWWSSCKESLLWRWLVVTIIQERWLLYLCDAFVSIYYSVDRVVLCGVEDLGCVCCGNLKLLWLLSIALVFTKQMVVREKLDTSPLGWYSLLQ